MGEVKNIPELRFNGFSEEWEQKRITEVARVFIGLVTTMTTFYRKSGILLIRNSDIKNNYFSFADSPIYLDEKFASDNASRKLQVEDIVTVHTGDVGTSAVISKREDGAIGFATINTRPDKSLVDSNYLSVYFNSEPHKSYAILRSTGDGRANYNLSDFLQLVIPIPKIEEQKTIGTFFKNLDNQITLKQHKLDKLVTLKKAMLEKMFPKDGADEPEIRFKGFSGTWNSELLDANADFAKGQGYSKSDLVEAGTPIVLYGRLYTKYESFISKVDTFVNAKPGSLFSKGCEVVVPASGETAEDIARASAILKEGVLLGGDLNIIYPNEKFTSVFLALSLSNGKVQKDLSKRAQGKSVVHVRNSDIKELEISFPSIEEQKAIGAYFAKLDDLISLQKTELTKLKQIKSSCLEKMFV